MSLTDSCNEKNCFWVSFFYSITVWWHFFCFFTEQPTTEQHLLLLFPHLLGRWGNFFPPPLCDLKFILKALIKWWQSQKHVSVSWSSPVVQSLRLHREGQRNTCPQQDRQKGINFIQKSFAFFQPLRFQTSKDRDRLHQVNFAVSWLNVVCTTCKTFSTLISLIVDVYWLSVLIFDFFFLRLVPNCRP